MDTNLHKYIAFTKTIELGSFSKAADFIGYSQSGVSRMISDLEKEWAVTLIERKRTGITLTSDGTKILPHIQKIVKDYEKLQMEIDDIRGLESGLIRIGTFSSVGTHRLPKIISGFRKKYPNIDYDIRLGNNYKELEEWIEDGLVDIGFTHLPTVPGFDTIRLAGDDLLAVLPENHRFKDCEKYPFSELENEPFIILEQGTEEEICGITGLKSLKFHANIITWDDYAIMAMVESGLGITILPRLVMERSPYKLSVKEFDIPIRREIGLAVRSKNDCSLAAKRFIEYISENTIKGKMQ